MKWCRLVDEGLNRFVDASDGQQEILRLEVEQDLFKDERYAECFVAFGRGCGLRFISLDGVALEVWLRKDLLARCAGQTYR